MKLTANNMKREIKFRVWEYIRHKNSYGFNYFIGLIDDDKKHYDLMQFTGLKDRNGIEIYEGDILSFEDDPAGVVKWNSDFSCWTYWESEHINNQEEVFDWSQLLKRDCEHYVVRGNIYENPDLLL
jgi:uncharacterized phage protein (TIGR01671 family)